MPAPRIESPDEARAVAKLITTGKLTGAARDTAMAALREFNNGSPDAPAAPPSAASMEQYRPMTSGMEQAYQQRAQSMTDTFMRESTPAKVAAGIGEAGLNMGTSMVAAPVSGLVGLTAAPFGNDTATRLTQGTQEAMTYQPRTAVGQGLAYTAAAPFQAYGDAANRAGEYVADKTGSPLAGTATNVGINAIPILATRRGGKVGGAAVAEQEAAARAYVSRAGIDWDSLSESVKAQLTGVASDARNLDRLDPAATRREAFLQSLPIKVPATRGQLTRDPVQLRNEGTVSATKGGAPIREVHEAANKALLDNLELLKGKTRGKADTPEQVGMSIQGPLRQKLEAKKREVSELYRVAEAAGELQGKVSPKGLIDVIEAAPDKTHFGWVESWMNKMGVRDKGAINKLSLKQMEDLRQAAVARRMNGGTEGYYAGKVIDAIDSATESAGGKAYKLARKARREQALEFEEQAAVERLVTDKSRTDRATALEDTWRKTVLGGSIEDLHKVKLSLLTGNAPKGKQAWRDMRAQTIQHIINEATRGVAPTERGAPNITPAAMKRAFDSIGPDKLNEIFGAGTSRALTNIMEATRIVKTDPPPGFKGSPTFANAVAFLERGLGNVPGGDIVSGAVRVGANVKEVGRTGREVRKATTSPLEEAMGRYAKEKRNRGAKNALGGSLPATYGDN